MFLRRDKANLTTADEALPGRAERPFTVPEHHFVLGTPLEPPFPDGLEQIVFGMGCFWGAERKFWTAAGVYTTAVGYAGGFTAEPHVRRDVLGHVPVTPRPCSWCSIPRSRRSTRCSASSGRATTRPRACARATTSVRSTASAIYTFDDAQAEAVEASRKMFQEQLNAADYGEITTEIKPAGTFYYAEDYHQQYLAKNPNGYCGLGGTGVSCPIGVGTRRVTRHARRTRARSVRRLHS